MALNLDSLFYPSSIALMGASTEADSGTNAMFLAPLLDFGFKGPIYPVNPKAEEIMGLKAYPSLSAIPAPVDYVIFALAASLLLGVVEECLHKGVKALHIFSAGFSELGGEAGRRLEGAVVARARAGGMRVIGPNCFGLSCAGSGLCSMPDMDKRGGPAALISQSAATARDLTEGLAQRGVGLDKVANYGNGADLNEADFLEYFAVDEKVRVIALYIEGVKSPRFFPVLKEAAARKAVVIHKGGRTEAGQRAATSHTAALATNIQVWEGLCRQAGAMVAETLEEMEDLVVTACHLHDLKGRRAAIVISSGGFCVQAVDDCEQAGLQVPPLPPETQGQLREFIPGVGTSLRNPVDVPPGLIWNAERYYRTLSILSQCSEIDVILNRMFIPASTYKDYPRVFQGQVEGLLRAHREGAKPLAVAIRFTGAPQSAEMGWKLAEHCRQGPIALYPSLTRAAGAIGKYCSFLERRRP